MRKKTVRKIITRKPIKGHVLLKDIDYKNVDVLKKFLNQRFRIMPRKVTGISAKKQRKLSKEIKKSRVMGLIPYTDMHSLKIT